MNLLPCHDSPWITWIVSVAPDVDFYRFACGAWLKNNPVPEDKPSWASFMEVRERNTQLLHGILEEAAKSKGEGSPIARKLGDFYHSALNTSKLDELKFAPLQDDFRLVGSLQSTSAVIELMARFLMSGKGGNVFHASVAPDEHNSVRYILQLGQGGLSLPDRDYYLTDQFAKERTAYVAHVAKMFRMSGDSEAQASEHAGRILDLETALAKASKSRVQLGPDRELSQIQSRRRGSSLSLARPDRIYRRHRALQRPGTSYRPA